MAVIHEKLYQTDELISIRLDEYFRDIADRVISEFESGNVHITLSITGSSDIFVDINTGIPLGLIMNELITNCMKYAFCPGQTGEIRIDLCKDGEFLTISVIDTGKGFPHDGIRMSDSSLGFELIKGLSLQLQGTVEWKNSGGACCMVTIPFAKTDNNEVSCQKVVEY
jgi:two-component sensor histidine kinase